MRKKVARTLIITARISLHNFYLLPGLKCLCVSASIDNEPFDLESSFAEFGYMNICFDYRFYIDEFMMKLLGEAIRAAEGNPLIIRCELKDGSYREMFNFPQNN